VQEWQRAMILFSFVGSDYLQTLLGGPRVLFFISLFQSPPFLSSRLDLSPLPPVFFAFFKRWCWEKGTKGPKKCVSKKRQVAIKYARANIEYK
jgi:hypothetical protein|tara:strand:- start:3064 stop:3342 length:279 start_codon:yes stop_codon:yes gene_type:complete